VTDAAWYLYKYFREQWNRKELVEIIYIFKATN
jgi:hypothetical protein